MGYSHKIRDIKDPTTSTLVKKCLQGIRSRGKARVSRVDRDPIDVNSLQKLCEIAPQTLPNPGTSQAFQALCCTMLFGLFRVSELLGDKRLNIPSIKWEDLKLRKNTIQITLRTFKHSNNEAKIILTRQPNKFICPVRRLKKLFKSCRNMETAVFCSGQGLPLSKNSFSQFLRKCSQAAGFSKPFLSHCFRIGGATEAAKQGKSELQIKALGRWRSGAFTKYVRMNPSLQIPKTPLSADSWPGGCRRREERAQVLRTEPPGRGGR